VIPFNVPYVPEISKQYVLEALVGSDQQGDGRFTTIASKLVSDLVGGGHVLLKPSCTHALEMASMLANLGPGDEVILPSYTFTSAATAVTKFGATPVFVDIEMQTKGIDVNQVREAITPKTKAISWVNYAGVAPDIDGLQNIAKEFDILLIEDNAHGLGGSYRGKPLGSFGDFATQSFHATKNIQCGEGGALIINNEKFRERAEIIREKGTDRSKFIRGEVQKYQWVDHGSSYLLAEALSAILVGQLENFAKIQNYRCEIHKRYVQAFSNFKRQSSLKNDVEVAHLFYLELNSSLELGKLKKSLDLSGVNANTHYQPLHNSKFGQVKSKGSGSFPNSVKVADTLLRLPIWYGLDTRSVDKIIATVLKQYPNDSEEN